MKKNRLLMVGYNLMIASSLYLVAPLFIKNFQNWLLYLGGVLGIAGFVIYLIGLKKK